MFERDISADAVMDTVKNGEIIAEYRDDQPYPSYLLLGFVESAPLHVVIGVDPESSGLHVITVYCPERHLWSCDYKTRKR